MVYVTDRTQADVDRIKELLSIGYANMTARQKAEWNSGLKGAFNYTDINRIETATKMISDSFSLGLLVKNDWANTDIPSLADMTRLLNNVKTCRNKFNLSNILPDSMLKLSYEQANDIEKALQAVEIYINRYYFCSEIYCGEV